LREHTTATWARNLSTFASCIPTILHSRCRRPVHDASILLRDSPPCSPTPRGRRLPRAGRPEATYLVERLVETAARGMRIDPAELRPSQLHQDVSLRHPVGLTYDTGDYDATLARAMELAESRGSQHARRIARRTACCAGWATPPTSRPAALRRRTSPGRSARGRLFEPAEVRVHPTGKVTDPSPARTRTPGPRDDLRAGGPDKLGIGMDDVDIQHGDTGKILFGQWALRCRARFAVGGTAIIKRWTK